MTRTHQLSTLCLALVLATPAYAGRAFVFPMSAAEEVPPVASQASGTCLAILSEDETELELHCTHDVAEPTAAHVHVGPRGTAGPVVFPLTAASPIQATLTLNAAQAADLLTGGLYVNVHTAENPGGEIRGQLALATEHGVNVMNVDLVDDEGGVEGACVAMLTQGHQLEVICTHDRADVTDAQLRLGGPGAAGTLIVDLGDGTSPVRGTVALDAIELGALAEGNLFVLLDATADLRAQLDGCFGDANTLCLNRGRFRVEASWQTAVDEGVGHAVPETDETGHFWFFGPQNIEVTVKVLDGCSHNGNWWVFAAGLTNQQVTLRVTDTRSGLVKTYTNPLGQAFAPIQDTLAFATCP